MGSYIINGKQRLKGEIDVSGAKNAALPLLATALLSKEEVIIHNCPRIDDVFDMQEILSSLGIRVKFSGNTVSVLADNISTCAMPEELSHKIRSSIFLLGSMLGREKEAYFFSPGGCEIGSRPIDQHLNALKLLGADVKEVEGKIICKTKGLYGNDIKLSYPSVGATENAMLAAALADGVTTIENAAKEPEIEAVQNLINAMGGKVRGAGSSIIRIEGVKKMHGAEIRCIPDRIEAGTFLAAAAVTRGSISIKNTIPLHLKSVTDVLQRAGAKIRCYEDAISIDVDGHLKCFNITTQPYPDFPTDMQPQMCTVAAISEGVSRITETVFENRMRHILELVRAGADISLSGGSAYIMGVYSFKPNIYKATDLRGGAAMVLAALSVEGKSRINNIEHIERGYERLEHKISLLGGDMRRL
jgi:UDP-N-acetylglucosamine 1-carboxyvinyltransferase